MDLIRNPDNCFFPSFMDGSLFTQTLFPSLASHCGQHIGGCQLLIVTVLQSGVVLISCIDFYVIHLLAGSPKQESIL